MPISPTIVKEKNWAKHVRGKSLSLACELDLKLVCIPIHILLLTGERRCCRTKRKLSSSVSSSKKTQSFTQVASATGNLEHILSPSNSCTASIYAILSCQRL